MIGVHDYLKSLEDIAKNRFKEAGILQRTLLVKMILCTNLCYDERKHGKFVIV